jgi:transketolase
VTRYEEALLSLARERPEVMVLTAENRAPIPSLSAQLGPRFIDVGIAEQTMVGMAAGLALRGRVPVVHALAAFLTMRAFEFIRTDVGYPGLPVKLVGYIPGFASEANGPTHQALEDVALMRGIPGMTVFCPADAEELADALPTIVDSPGPWYVRYTAAAAAVTRHTPFVTGRAETLSRGAGVAILTYGPLLAQALDASRRIEKSGASVRLLNLRTLKPVDEAAIIEAARSTALLVTIEDHFMTGGLATIVSEILVRRGVSRRLLALALADRWFTPALLDDVLAHEGFTGARIAETILTALGATVLSTRFDPCDSQ